MSRWFRMYDELLNDPKVQKLSGDDFKAWVNLLCVASQNGGKLPAAQDIAFALRETVNAIETLLERLLNAGLIDVRNGGANGKHYAPHRWDERQYKSDTSTGRVKRFRQRSKSVSETPPETDTETEETVDKSTVRKTANFSGRYAFAGKVIRLTAKDFETWKAAYHAIPDLIAELTSLDTWLTGQPEAKRKAWFQSVSGSLNRKHQEFLRSPPSGPHGRPQPEDPNAVLHKLAQRYPMPAAVPPRTSLEFEAHEQ